MVGLTNELKVVFATPGVLDSLINGSDAAVLSELENLLPNSGPDSYRRSALGKVLRLQRSHRCARFECRDWAAVSPKDKILPLFRGTKSHDRQC